jgi:hypothetical protein
MKNVEQGAELLVSVDLGLVNGSESAGPSAGRKLQHALLVPRRELQLEKRTRNRRRNRSAELKDSLPDRGTRVMISHRLHDLILPSTAGSEQSR